MNTKTHTDIKRPFWIERLCPAKIQPFLYLARLDRPIGIWLLFWPCLWGIILATADSLLFYKELWAYVGLFFIGAVLMRAAGCTINDIWDRDLDKQVARTKDRPIAAGLITIKSAVLFLCLLLLSALNILAQFNQTTILLGILVLPLVILYPVMKRLTWWPQAFLALTFNFGALMGWSVINDAVALPAVLLYIGGVFWTLGYDTIYAYQDIEDDALAGIKSTARKFQQYGKLWVGGFYTAALLSFISASYTIYGFNAGFLLFALPVFHFIWQITRWQLDDKSSALYLFKANIMAGALIAAALFYTAYFA